MPKLAFITHSDANLMRLAETIAFSCGFYWRYAHSEHSTKPRPCLGLKNNYLGWGEYDYYIDKGYLVIDLAPFKALFEQRETIELNGNKYLKSELEEALKHIKPID